MDKLRKKRKMNLLASKIRSPRKKKESTQVSINNRTRKIVALIPPVQSDGPSSSEEEEVGEVSILDGIDNEHFQVHCIENDMQATLADIVKEVPCSTRATFLEQQNDSFTSINLESYGQENIDFSLIDDLSLPPQIFSGPSTSNGVTHHGNGDHSYSLQQQNVSYILENECSSQKSVLSSPPHAMLVEEDMADSLLLNSLDLSLENSNVVLQDLNNSCQNLKTDHTKSDQEQTLPSLPLQSSTKKTQKRLTKTVKRTVEPKKKKLTLHLIGKEISLF